MNGFQFPLVKELFESMRDLPPNENLSVSMRILPESRRLGTGQTLTMSGNVTFFGIGIPVPVVIVAIRDKTASPVGFGLSLPFTGAYSIPVSTGEDWALGSYEFSAMALAPLTGPGISSGIEKVFEPPRRALTVALTRVREAASPVQFWVDEGGTLHVDYTVKNTGNVEIAPTVYRWLGTQDAEAAIIDTSRLSTAAGTLQPDPDNIGIPGSSYSAVDDPVAVAANELPVGSYYGFLQAVEGTDILATYRPTEHVLDVAQAVDTRSITGYLCLPNAWVKDGLSHSFSVGCTINNTGDRVQVIAVRFWLRLRFPDLTQRWEPPGTTGDEYTGIVIGFNQSHTQYGVVTLPADAPAGLWDLIVRHETNRNPGMWTENYSLEILNLQDPAPAAGFEGVLWE